MKKNSSQKGKWASDIHLNLSAVQSFISDVKVKDNISEEEMASAVLLKEKQVIVDKEIPKQVDYSVPLEKNGAFSSIENQKPSCGQTEGSHKKNKKEQLIDIVETLDSCAEARRGTVVDPVARVHCIYDGYAQTFWFTNKSINTYDCPELNKFGRFVPKYSDVAIRMQRSEVGSSFDYASNDYIGRLKQHHVILENQSNLQNQTIAIAGDNLKYQYRDIKDFLEILRQNAEIINDVKSQIIELKEQWEEENNPHKRGQITNTIKKLQEQYRILTQQQEDLKNITIYIRKQSEMRYSLIVDPVQTRIMSKHLFDGKTVVIKGGPGTGKTTTMIHRLAYLTDTFAINEDENKKQGKYKLTHSQRKQLLKAKNNNCDWMFFSPSRMLKEYLSDAMKKEGLVNTLDKVWCWKDYSRMILRDYYHLLDDKDDSTPFSYYYSNETLFYQGYDIINLFNEFYLNGLRGIYDNLPTLETEGKVNEWTSIAQRIRKRFEDAVNSDLTRFVSLFNTLEFAYRDDCKRLLREKNNVLNGLAEMICKLLDANADAKSEISELFELTSEGQSDDNELIEEDEESEVGLLKGTFQKLLSPILGSKTKNNELLVYLKKWLKSYCYYKTDGAKKLTVEHEMISEILLPLIGDKFDKDIKKIGELMVFEHYAQYTRGVCNILLNGIIVRYKEFRTYLNKIKYAGCNQKLLRDIMQSRKGRELHPQEQSLLLGFINTLVKTIKASSNSEFKHEYIYAYESVARPIIGIDEATDFSICEIYAMQSLLLREFSSLTLCGDIMQRMTSYGIKSWKELSSVLVDPEMYEMKVSYRQSKKLLEVAKSLCMDELREEPQYRAFMTSNKVPAPLVYVEKNEQSKIEWISKRISEVYRAYGENLPSIAIFVTDKGYIPQFLANLQDTSFFKETEIKVLDGVNANRTAEKHICVYPIDVVKGMEFDVVFFHNVDKTDAEMDFIKRFIYVGLSRAAFFLGVTMEDENVDISRYFEKNKDWFKI